MSSLSIISSVCPNIESWYELAKTSETYGSKLYNSTSAISELGSVIGKIKIKITIIEKLIFK